MNIQAVTGLTYDYKKLDELAKLMDGESLLNLLLADDPFYRSNICKICGGLCCKLSACSAIPQDFEFDVNNMDSCISSGKYCISYICKRGFVPPSKSDQVIITIGQIRSRKTALVVRPRNINANIIDFSLSFKGPCMLWSPSIGCSLPIEKRPIGAKGLVPISPGICREIYDFDSFFNLWFPFQNDMLKLIKKYR